MSDIKDDEEMIGHEDDSSDGSESEDLIDADVDHDESNESDEQQIPDENGDSPPPSDGSDGSEEGEKEGEEGSEDKEGSEGDREGELDKGAPLDGKQGDLVEPLHEQVVDGGASSDDVNGVDKRGNDEGDEMVPVNEAEPTVRCGVSDLKQEEEKGEELKNEMNGVAGVNPMMEREGNAVKEENLLKQESAVEEYPGNTEGSNQSFPSDQFMVDGDDTGTEEEQAAFMKELENFFKEKSLEFKPPKFYGEGLNCLKLWRQVTRLGGYDRVTACKLWRQVGESFKPPKTCTTVSWSFRIFYEKALLDYERHKMRGGELHLPDASLIEPTSVETPGGHQASGSGRARRDAAARAMQGWHSQRLLGNGEVGDPIIKDKSSVSLSKREKQLKSVGLLKRKKPSSLERAVKAARTIPKVAKPQMDTMVADVGIPADWVKINVRRTKDCFEVYALVPGLLREEVRVQSDPAGRLVISGDPEQPDNPWGVTPFKKVITLPSRIDPHQTSAVVTLHGQLFVRVPFEQSDL